MEKIYKFNKFIDVVKILKYIMLIWAKKIEFSVYVNCT